MKTFQQLNIKKEYIKALKDLNITTPTSIQEKVIPLLLENNMDLVGQAQTGTGKTAAFALPLLHKINTSEKHVQAIILTPTRELGQQIAKHIFKLTKYSDRVFTEAVFGGAHIKKQLDALRRPTHIIVATPGRLVDLINRKAVSLNQVRYIILDEVDEMLSMGFKKDLGAILDSTPSSAHKWLFSATIPEGVRSIIKTHFSPQAKSIEVAKADIMNKNINHQYAVCTENEKMYVILQQLQTNAEDRGVIFCKTKAMAGKLAKRLISKNIPTDAIQGDLTQKERDKVMRRFINKELRVLIATDVAARGIDVENLSFVIHYQLPDRDEYFTHRSGRTARAGKKGISLCLISSYELKQLKYYENTFGIKFTQIKEM